MDARELYDAHALGAQREFATTLLNGLREHIDRIAEVCKLVHELKPRRVLDVPCNNGLITALVKLYLDGPEKVVGADVSPVNCRVAQQVFGVEAIAHDISTAPLPGYDLVLCMELLEHVDDPARVVQHVLASTSRYAIFSVPIEAEPVDGTYHVRKVHPTALWDWITAAGGRVERLFVLPSAFGEKPKWLGWLYAVAMTTDEVRRG